MSDPNEDFQKAHNEAATSIDDGRLHDVVGTLTDLQSDYVIEIEKYGIVEDTECEQLSAAIDQIEEIMEIAKSVRAARSKPKTWYGMLALAPDVLAVAVAHPDVGDWAVYIGSVPGIDHEGEKNLVATTGSKCSEAMASLLFPNFAEKYKWRK